MTPLERAAKAAEDAIFNPSLKANISIQCDDPGRVHRAIARAVIAATHEPIGDWLQFQIEHGHAPDGFLVEMTPEYEAGRRSAFEAARFMIKALLEDNA